MTFLLWSFDIKTEAQKAKWFVQSHTPNMWQNLAWTINSHIQPCFPSFLKLFLPKDCLWLSKIPLLGMYLFGNTKWHLFTTSKKFFSAEHSCQWKMRKICHHFLSLRTKKWIVTSVSQLFNFGSLCCNLMYNDSTVTINYYY